MPNHHPAAVHGRLARLTDKLGELELDALLVSNLPNIYYLSGFSGSTALLLITTDKKWIITDFRYHEQVGKEVDSAFELVDNTSKKLFEEVLPSIGAALPGGRLGYEAAHTTEVSLEKYKEASTWELISTIGVVEELRLIKDEGELELLEASTRLNERIFTELLGVIGPETTELDLAAEVYFRAVKHGAEGVSFDPIIGSGPNGARPHAGFSGQKLVRPAPLVIDMGVVLNGYCSDMTRTVFIGDCGAKWEKIYNIVRTAKDMAFAAIMPGKTGAEIDTIARDYIYSQGYEGKFGHSLGHGVGIEVHENPRLAQRVDTPLVAGHVVTDEPGIYLPGEGGVRIEDIVVVTEDGARILNELDTEIKVVG